jgi:hypothetical protein
MSFAMPNRGATVTSSGRSIRSTNRASQPESHVNEISIAATLADHGSRIETLRAGAADLLSRMVRPTGLTLRTDLAPFF